MTAILDTGRAERVYAGLQKPEDIGWLSADGEPYAFRPYTRKKIGKHVYIRWLNQRCDLFSSGRFDMGNLFKKKHYITDGRVIFKCADSEVLRQVRFNRGIRIPEIEYVLGSLKHMKITGTAPIIGYRGDEDYRGSFLFVEIDGKPYGVSRSSFDMLRAFIPDAEIAAVERDNLKDKWGNLPILRKGKVIGLIVISFSPGMWDQMQSLKDPKWPDRGQV